MYAAQIRTLWLKAGIIGSTWAAFEIIAGSFLHNLQIPFAGTILSAASVFLLISFLQIWPEKGLIIRAGIVCALMKSISPSAVIIGPMVGIFMEGLLIEIMVLFLGRNLLGYIAAGAVAVLWSLTQKILFLLLMYGMDLIALADSLYEYLIQISGIDTLSSVYLITGIVCAYLIFGALAAYAGYLSGNQYLKMNLPISRYIETDHAQKMKIESQPKQSYSLGILALLILAIVLNLYFINNHYYWPAGIGGTVFIVFTIFRYKNSTKHLRKPRIWIQFLLITTLAAFLWQWATSGSHFSTAGLIVGLKMNYRALIIIFGFAAVGVELRNPLVKALLYRNGFRQLHHTLTFAFSTLPSIIESMPKPSMLLKKRNLVMAQLLNQSQNLLDQIEETKK